VPLLRRARRGAGVLGTPLTGALSFVVVALCATPRLAAQSFRLTSPNLTDSVALAGTMARLADQVLGAYRENDWRTALDDLFRLQIVAGRNAAAAHSLAELRALRSSQPNATVQTRATNVQYEIYVRAKILQGPGGRPFPQAFAQAFREAFAGLDDRTSALVARAFNTCRGSSACVADPATLRDELRQAIGRQQGKTELSLADALSLLRAYQLEESYRHFASLTGPLVAEDDRRRYVIEKDIRVSTPDGATVCAMLVRPRVAKGRLPALLEFTIYADSVATFNEARRTASNGYVGVEGFTRGKGCSPDQPVPYEHDGSDAAAVIDWISRQAWSDGRVGMYGGSYNGFTQWAAAKHMPGALKALMPSVTVAPGIDVPMEGNVFQSFVYYWPLYTTTGKALDYGALNDRARWQRLNHDWYVSGRAYRDLDKIDGTPNPVFGRWLDHPSYDAYWQSMIPYREEFARIDIPVLTTTGYYDGGQIGALHYLMQHYRYNPGAEHYLVVGPYDHFRGQRGTTSSLGDEFNVLAGYEIDSVAHIDVGELRYEWFDHVFKGGPKPALLKDRINYEVMGANVWKHAPSLDAMSNRTLRFHLSALRSGDLYRLSTQKPPGHAVITHQVDLADRSDADRMSPANGIVDRLLDTWNSVAFVSDPLRQSTEISGLFTGQLDFVINKHDVDLAIGLYELTPDGEYVALSYYLARASYVRDNSRRQPLATGLPQRLNFKSGRLTSRKFPAGSRLVVVLTVVKQPSAQINYGTMKDVSDETVADAGEALTIQWSGDSFIDVPAWR